MENKQKIPAGLRDELIKLFGEEKARELIDSKKGAKGPLQYLAFKKQFRKNFGIRFNVVLITFMIILAFLLFMEISGI